MSASRLRQARRADRSQLKARVAIDGPTGAGKTWTALVWATELAGPDGSILVLDTEHGSAEWYSDHFDYDVITWAPPYAPNELADTIAEAAGKYDVVVTDSFSHFWEGEGGTRDIVDAAAERARGNSFAGWKVGTPALRRLIDTILAADAHVICTMRSKMEYVLETDERTGKQVPKKVGMAPVMRQGVEYEFTLIADMDLEHRFVVTKSRCPALSDQVYQPHMAGDGARAFLAWLNDGVSSIAEADATRLAEALNGLGQEARKRWLDTFNCKPTALPENRLAEANEFVARLAAAPPQDEPDPEPPAPDGAPPPEPDPDPPPAAEDDTPRQAAPQALNARDIAKKASAVFKPVVDDAPRGTKKIVGDRLRHAVVYATTRRRTSSASDLDGAELVQAWHRLDDIAEGRLRYTADPVDDDGQITFHLQAGDLTLTWAEIEKAHSTETTA